MPEVNVALRHLIAQREYHAVTDALTPYLASPPGTSTHINVVSGIRLYFKWVEQEQRSVLNADLHQAAAYRHWLITHYAPATIKNRLTQVRTLYDILYDQGLVSGNPYRSIIGVINHPEEHRQAYTADEIAQLLRHATLEERALVLLGAHGGLTGPEVLKLTFKDLDLTSGTLRTTNRTVNISEDLRTALEQWGRQRGHTALFNATGRVFDIEAQFFLRKRLFFLCRRAGVTYRAWQALRNAAGLRLLENTDQQLLHSRQQLRQHLGLGSTEAIRPLLKLSLKKRDPTT